MGKRSWLSQVLNESLLPSLAGLDDSDTGRAEVLRLAQALRLDWEKRGFDSLAQQQGLMDLTRRAIKDQFGDDHFSLEIIKFSTEEYVTLNDRKQRSVAERNEAVKQLDNPDEIVAIAVRLLDSPEWAEVAAGLAVLTGRRSSELLSTGRFDPKSLWSVTFAGALKRRGEVRELCFEIPTLATAEQVCTALDKIRRQLPQALSMSASSVNAKYGQAVATACDRCFAQVVPPRKGGNLYTHLFRAVYATIATFWYCPPSVDPIEFRAAIQGHFAVLDADNPELRRSLAASRHYADFEIADQVVAFYGGMRKGIKLGAAGVVPIEMFAHAMEVVAMDDFPVSRQSRKSRSSLRVWKEDRVALDAILGQFDGSTQADKVQAWIDWSRRTLGDRNGETGQSETEMIEVVVVPEPTTSPETLPLAIASQKPDDQQPDVREIATGLEDKIDRLVDVMSQFVSLQLHSQQQASGADPKSAKSAAQSAMPDMDKTPRRRYNTGNEAEVINAAIDAIFAHNDAQELHDLKWEVTINAIKTFTRNQRAIERVLGKGKSNPDVERIVGTREEEIEQHHAKHKIQPGHNHRHKRKRTIGEVISLG